MQERNIVQEVCEELNISQAELAREFGITTSAISKWNTREMPKIAQKALEYMLKSHKQEKKLKTLKAFKNVLLSID